MAQNYYNHVYLSPHLDDIALSCAGRIAAQVAAGELVLVVTVFSGSLEKRKRIGGKFSEFGGYGRT